MSERISRRLPALDGLRALAALGVFGVHYNQIVRLDARLGPFDLERLLANGNHGVSLFLILSGFLLSIPFWKAFDRDRTLPDLRRYAIRRASRILPAYYLALTVLVFTSGLWRVPAARIDVVLHYTFLFNFFEFSIFSLNPVFWTLALEMQFYLALPLVFLLLRGAGGRRPLLVIGLLALASYGAHLGMTTAVATVIPWPLDPRLAWIRPGGAVLHHSPLANFPHFLLGVAASRIFFRFREGPGRSIERLRAASDGIFWISLLLAGVLLGTGLSTAIEAPRGTYGIPLVPLLLAALILSAPHAPLARRALESPPLRWLGMISYGFYLFHVPCLNALDRHLTRTGTDLWEHWFAFGAGGALLGILVAGLSWFFVEKPALWFIGRAGRRG